jgi:hypothetical protein
MATGGRSLTTEADDLYASPMPEFTRARDARARELRDAGDVALAARVRVLTKPSAAASSINQLARTDRTSLEPLEPLASRFREAATQSDPAQLAALARERRATVADIVGRARALAADQSQQLGPAAIRELEATLHAAIADRDAAAAVMTGRLVRCLETDGLEPVDLDGAVAGDASETRRPDKPAQPRESATSRRRAEALLAAQRELKKADTERARLAQRDEKLIASSAELDARASELQVRFDDLERDRSAVDDDRARLDRDRAAADRQMRAVQKKFAEL